MVDGAAVTSTAPAAHRSGRSARRAHPLTDGPRYAVYAAPQPGSALAGAAAAWLGRDADAGVAVAHPTDLEVAPAELAELTAAPRRYGFHATLRAPFHPADGVTRADVAQRVDRLAAAHAPVDVALALRTIAGFAALVPAEPTPGLEAIAAACVTELDDLRRAPAPDDLARRRRTGLTPRQDELLVRWGYPYVLDELRLHLTLTRRLDDDERDRVLAAARRWFACVERTPLAVRDLCVFAQPDPGAPFTVVHRAPLRGTTP